MANIGNQMRHGEWRTDYSRLPLAGVADRILGQLGLAT
jgi:hypothetical protein